MSDIDRAERSEEKKAGGQEEEKREKEPGRSRKGREGARNQGPERTRKSQEGPGATSGTSRNQQEPGLLAQERERTRQEGAGSLPQGPGPAGRPENRRRGAQARTTLDVKAAKKEATPPRNWGPAGPSNHPANRRLRGCVRIHELLDEASTQARPSLQCEPPDGQREDLLACHWQAAR